jgi:hypothetical protein
MIGHTGLSPNDLGRYGYIPAYQLGSNGIARRGQNGIGRKLQCSAVFESQLIPFQSVFILEFHCCSYFGEGDVSVKPGMRRFTTVAQLDRSYFHALHKKLRHYERRE